MNWLALTSLEQLEAVTKESFEHPIMLFKHSIRCSISSMAKQRLERSKAPDALPFYYLDLINYRAVSNAIAEKFQVHHESPQILLIKNGACIYDESHNGINMAEIEEQFMLAAK
jgi:bacillithiol system protein YtxJ